MYVCACIYTYVVTYSMYVRMYIQWMTCVADFGLHLEYVDAPPVNKPCVHTYVVLHLNIQHYTYVGFSYSVDNRYCTYVRAYVCTYLSKAKTIRVSVVGLL